MSAFAETDAENMEIPVTETRAEPRAPMEAMGSLKRFATRCLTKGAAAISGLGFHLLSKLSGVPLVDQLVNIPLIFWTPIKRGALGIGLQAGLANFIGPKARDYIKLVRPLRHVHP